jgi:glutamate synthase domain-containing protein 3
MTNGRAVILGPTGRNFAAGMSGGIAYVHDPNDEFITRCNLAMVEIEKPINGDIELIRELIEEHHLYTASPVAERILKDWEKSLSHFKKVMPTEYKKALGLGGATAGVKHG